MVGFVGDRAHTSNSLCHEVDYHTTAGRVTIDEKIGQDHNAAMHDAQKNGSDLEWSNPIVGGHWVCHCQDLGSLTAIKVWALT